MEFKQISLANAELKFASDGTKTSFSGYASMFGGVDTYGDTVHPGAFRPAIGDGAEVKMYFNHGWIRRELPIGKMFVQEDDRGLFVRSAEFTHGIKMADDVALAVKHNTVNGLSIGYRVKDSGVKMKSAGKGRDIHEIEFLKEVSVVDWPSDHSAIITDVKSVLEEAVSLKEIEGLLRDAGGFSRSDATSLVARIKSLTHGEREAEAKTSDILAAIHAATLKLTNGAS